MSSALNALTTQLTWQKNEVTFELTAAEQEEQALEQQLKEFNLKLAQSSSSSQFINPELEINRMNFVMQLQQQKAEILSLLKAQQELIAKLNEKLQRIKNELKMLERYLERKEELAQRNQRKSEEQSVEEWVLQKRETA